MEHVSFRLDGGELTRLVRSIYADDQEPEKAQRILEAAFPAMAPALRLAVLTGSKQLVGNDHGMDLVDDNATETECGCPLNLAHMHMTAKRDRDHLQDLLELRTGNTKLIGSPDGPIYIPMHRVEDYRAGRVDLADMLYTCRSPLLPEERKRAFIDPFGRAAFNRDELSDDDLISQSDEHPRVSTIKRQHAPISTFSKGVFNRDGLSGGDPTPRSDDYPVVKNSTITGDSGWLSPEGWFYPCGYQGHIALADALGYEEKQVEALGWVKLTPGHQPFPGDRPATQAQLDRLFDWLGHMPDWAADIDD